MDADEKARQRIGDAISGLRTARGMSIEAAAKLGNVTHTTWRRMERGQRVYPHTYGAVDTAFEMPAGSTLQALKALQDDGSVDLFSTYVTVGSNEEKTQQPGIGRGLADLVPKRSNEQIVNEIISSAERLPVSDLQRIYDVIGALLRVGERTQLQAVLVEAERHYHVTQARAAALNDAIHAMGTSAPEDHERTARLREAFDVARSEAEHAAVNRDILSAQLASLEMQYHSPSIRQALASTFKPAAKKGGDDDGEH